MSYGRLYNEERGMQRASIQRDENEKKTKEEQISSEGGADVPFYKLPMAIPACHRPHLLMILRYMGIGKMRTRHTGNKATMRMVEKRVISGLMSRKYDNAEYE